MPTRFNTPHSACSGGRQHLPGAMSLLLALLFWGCTPIKQVSSDAAEASPELVDFDDLWIAASYPCAGSVAPMLFRIEQVDVTLTAVSLFRNDCTRYGDRVWRGKLPHAPLARSDLPITFEVELIGANGKPNVQGMGTVVSIDRMLLDVGATPLIVTRAEAPADEALANAAPSGTDAADAGGTQLVTGAADGGSARAAADAALARSRDAGTKSGQGGGGSDTREQAGSGGSDASLSDTAEAGAGTDSDPSTRDWYCLSVQGSCTCVGGLGMSADMCSTPKPTCCFQLVAVGQPSCQCWPPDSEPCLTREREAPGSVLVETCPPP